MKKLLALPLLTLLLVFGNTAGVAAEDVFSKTCQAGNTSALCTEAGKTQTQKDNGLFGSKGILGKVADFLLVLVGVAGVIMIMVGGVQYSLSSGDPQKINKAKDLIIYAIVGIFVAFLARAIIGFVIGRVLK